MKILVTGGAGFIGSNFVRHMLNKYREMQIINLDALTYAGNLNNLRDIEKNPNYTFVKGDICNISTVQKATKDVDIIFNFAAESHVDRSISGGELFVRTNILGTNILLESAKERKIRFIQISTDEVYGSSKGYSFKETDGLNPSSPYSASKASADLLARSYFITHNLPVIITRTTNNFGPYQYPEKLIPLFITNLLTGKKAPLYGAGKNIRDWIYVLDNCRAIDFVSKKGKIGEVYNIGGKNEKTNLEITKLILAELGKDEKNIEYVKDRPGHDFRYSLDVEKIRKLGWAPSYAFEKALNDTIEWYEKNTVWWKKLKSEKLVIE